MQALDHSAYLALREDAQVLEADRFGDKVLRLRDGNFLKLFRRKRFFTSAALFPYAQRFANNARALQQRGIPCPQILAVYHIASIKRDAVYYAPLPGQTLRQLIEQTDIGEGMRAQLGSFVAQLHSCGVYFRSLHLGNIVLTPDNQLGLIDIADLQVHRSSLRLGKRLRNFSHLLRGDADRGWLAPPYSVTLFQSYADSAKLALCGSELKIRLGLSA